MNEATKWRLKMYLAEQNRFDVIDLLDKGADKQEVIDLFEKHNLLAQSPEYRRLQIRRLKNHEQSNKSRLLNNQISRLLQSLD